MQIDLTARLSPDVELAPGVNIGPGVIIEGPTRIGAGTRVQARAYIGPMHLATALRTPVVALFGPTAPGRTGPFGEGHQVVCLGLPCSPCFKRFCPEPRCLDDLPPEDLYALCEQLLENRR